MGTKLIPRILGGIAPLVALLSILLVSFYLLSSATENSTRFGDLYGWLLLINLAGLMVLTTLIGINLYRLVRQYRSGAAGSRLTVRLVLVFIVLSVLPVTVVYYFSLQFLQRGVDSWFDVRIEKSLEDALELSRASLELRKREVTRVMTPMAAELTDVTESNSALVLSDQLARTGAVELTLLGNNNRIIAFSSADPSKVVPHHLNDEALLQVRQGGHYVGMEPVREAGIHIRVIFPVPAGRAETETRLLQGLFSVDQRLSTLADSVQNYFAIYKKLSYLRGQLKNSFLLTLSMVLLLSLFSAVWVAFYSARRLVAPVRDLAEGTRAVAEGDYNKQLPAAGHDELGFLVRSFNDMTRRIARASQQARESQQKVEEQRAYLEAVLSNLSSGVITLDPELNIRTVNAAASQILDVELEGYLGGQLDKIASARPYLRRFTETLLPMLTGPASEWREEIILFSGGGRKVLMCRGTALGDVEDSRGDHVIVFDDVTTLVQAQRDAAWGEVARRLAHEIKNPLTPIQLSAERLRHKYLRSMNADDADVLDRSTHTIVQQVEAMKEMVNAFSEYARAPQMQLEQVNFNDLIQEVADLYSVDGSGLELQLNLDERMPMIEADTGRLRQVLHNLIKNAVEAMEKSGDNRVEVRTRCMDEAGCRFVEFVVRDYGSGFPEETLGQYFEPYITTKPKGTGLGLAIVKKIVEEHGGMVWAENAPDGGARIIIRLPVITTELRNARKTMV